MDQGEFMDDLCLRSRAYNLLYAMGETPATVGTLKPGEAQRLVALAQEAVEGKGTFFHRMIRGRVSANQLRYVATGEIGHEVVR